MAGQFRKKEFSAISANWKELQKELERESESSKKEKETMSSVDSDGFIKVVRKKNRKRKQESMEIDNEQMEPSKKKVARFLNGKATYTDSKAQEPTCSTVLNSVFGMDCEYVGVGLDGKDDALARVSIVNSNGDPVYDVYVKPEERVVDYRTEISGIRPRSLVNGQPFKKVQLEVHKLLAGKIVVGHALQNDFRVLGLSHTRKLTRDTSKYPYFRKICGITKTPSLKFLAEKLLGVNIQQGEHDSVVDARVPMKIYMLHRKKWEADIKRYLHR
ncbi:hypothetical protein AB6A40_009540 [Gnathostoma spinigerum]|uniref:RNA exonuclease 4 n=1 Tax=Gnathostoma spinigerum TaxID=75299 RepID=A0ABD6EU32_9BILA